VLPERFGDEGHDGMHLQAADAGDVDDREAGQVLPGHGLRREGVDVAADLVHPDRGDVLEEEADLVGVGYLDVPGGSSGTAARGAGSGTGRARRQDRAGDLGVAEGEEGAEAGLPRIALVLEDGAEDVDVEPGRWDQPAQVAAAEVGGQPEGDGRLHSGIEGSDAGGAADEVEGLAVVEGRDDGQRGVAGQERRAGVQPRRRDGLATEQEGRARGLAGRIGGGGGCCCRGHCV